MQGTKLFPIRLRWEAPTQVKGWYKIGRGWVRKWGFDVKDYQNT